MIRLQKVNEETFSKILAMKLPEEQNKFVAQNIVSLAQAWLYQDIARPFAILNNDEVVGFVMLDWDEDERTVGIWRFMIKYELQNKGYGKEAIKLIIDMAKENKNIDLMHLDYVEGNVIAKRLYESFGFKETGDIEDGEIVMTLKVKDEPRIGALYCDDEDLDEINDVISDDKDIPDKFKGENLEKLIEKEKLIKLTIYGDVIGISDKKDTYIIKEYSKYLDEALLKVKKLKKGNKR